jgi:hypothetical protein
MIDKSSFASPAIFYVKPWIWIIFDLSYKISSAFFSFNKSKHFGP